MKAKKTEPKPLTVCDRMLDIHRSRFEKAVALHKRVEKLFEDNRDLFDRIGDVDAGLFDSAGTMFFVHLPHEQNNVLLAQMLCKAIGGSWAKSHESNRMYSYRGQSPEFPGLEFIVFNAEPQPLDTPVAFI